MCYTNINSYIYLIRILCDEYRCENDIGGVIGHQLDKAMGLSDSN